MKGRSPPIGGSGVTHFAGAHSYAHFVRFGTASQVLHALTQEKLAGGHSFQSYKSLFLSSPFTTLSVISLMSCSEVCGRIFVKIIREGWKGTVKIHLDSLTPLLIGHCNRNLSAFAFFSKEVYLTAQGFDTGLDVFKAEVIFRLEGAF